MLLLVNLLVVANFGDTDHPLVNFLSLLFYVNLLVIPPSMFLYVKQYLSEKSLAEIIDENRRHYFPAIALFLINMCSFVILYRRAPNSDIGLMVTNVMTYANLIALFFVFLLQNFYYTYSAFKTYKGHIKNVSESFSFTEGIEYPWIRLFIWGYIILTISLYLQTMGLFGPQDWSFALIVGIYVAFMLYKGLQYPSFAEVLNKVEIKEDTGETKGLILAQSMPIQESEDIESQLSAENKKAKVSEDLQDKIWELTEELMQKEKYYLNQELTVYALAKAAETNSKYLRLTINNKFEKNFAAYVNSYRVEEAKELLLKSENNLYNIEYIGELAGFKSKSAFYTAFKKQTGLTPQAYRKNHST